MTPRISLPDGFQDFQPAAPLPGRLPPRRMPSKNNIPKMARRIHTKVTPGTIRESLGKDFLSGERQGQPPE